MPRLLRPGGVYSYFNGLAADNAFFHSVYCELVARELAALGFTTQFVPLPIAAAAAAEVRSAVSKARSLAGANVFKLLGTLINASQLDIIPTYWKRSQGLLAHHACYLAACPCPHETG